MHVCAPMICGSHVGEGKDVGCCSGCPNADIGLCVGFLYTEVMRELFGPKETSISKKGMAPCSFETSVVNCIWGFNELRWVRNCWMSYAL